MTCNGLLTTSDEPTNFTGIYCGFCSGDLSYAPVEQPNELIIYAEISIKIANWKKGTLHDELAIMNYICYYDKLSLEQRKKTIGMDLKIVK